MTTACILIYGLQATYCLTHRRTKRSIVIQLMMHLFRKSTSLLVLTPTVRLLKLRNSRRCEGYRNFSDYEELTGQGRCNCPQRPTFTGWRRAFSRQASPASLLADREAAVSRVSAWW